MPLSANSPSGPVTLSQNARTVLAKRYLVKDRAGAPVEQAGQARRAASKRMRTLRAR